MTNNRMTDSASNSPVAPSDGNPGRAQRLTYVFLMLRELREMAVAEKAETLAWLIDMAILEAGELAEAAKNEAA